jgi:RNA polymerase sigma-70 factor (ECF subfamily)
MNLFDLVVFRKIQQGDIKEYEKLFRKYYQPLCHFANRFLKDMDSSEEIVQELFYNIWKNRESISITSSLKAYLYQSVRNNSLKFIEHLAVRERYSSEMKRQQNEGAGNDSDSVELAELNELIENTLNQLPERCRQIFLLSRYEGLKYHEIAEKLSISIKTVEANMGKALQLFRTNLKVYDKLAC